jgi:hypothetical protein
MVVRFGQFSNFAIYEAFLTGIYNFTNKKLVITR